VKVGVVGSAPSAFRWRLLQEPGAAVSYHDPYVPVLRDFDLRSAWPEAVDCVVIVTAHPSSSSSGW